MNILWHMPTLRRSCCGLSHRAMRLARELSQAGHRITFTVTSDKSDVNDHRIDEFVVEILPAEKKRSLHWALQSHKRSTAARRAARHLSIRHDLFISCQPEMVSAYRQARGSAPVIFVCGGSTLLHEPREREEQSGLGAIRRASFALDRLLKRRAETRAMHAADAIVFDSRATRALAISSYGVQPEKCRAVIGGVDDTALSSTADRASIRKSLGLGVDDPIVAWTGRFSPEKNVSLLIRAAARCTTKPTLLLVGDGPLREELCNLCRKLGIAQQVIWPGSVACVRPFLQAADVFAFPSTGESFGGSLVEAMACGLPCIALRPNEDLVRTANAEILDHARTGWLVDSPAEASFAFALDYLLGESNLRQSIGQAARAIAMREFTWKRAGEELLDVLELFGCRKPAWKKSRPLEKGHPCVLAST
jgi:glycosyltransferase involved in cell wall biosynthesis